MHLKITTCCFILFASDVFGQGAGSSYARLVWQRQINIVKENEQRLLDYVARQKAKSTSNQNNGVEEKVALHMDEEEVTKKVNVNDDNLEKIDIGIDKNVGHIFIYLML